MTDQKVQNQLDYWILSGGTGTGKSALAIKVAQHLDLEILSVDSMLVYRGLNIGTAKPSPEELDLVPHHLIDVVDPWEDFNALSYLHHADKTYKKCHGKCIGVGGTPFYLKVLRDGLSQVENIPKLEEHLQRYPEAILRGALKRLDPERESAILPGDTFRLCRAMTLIFSSGQKASSFKTDRPRAHVSMNIVALRGERKKMHQLLKRRIDQMFEAGLLEEAKALFDGPELSQTAGAAVGYKELFAHFRGEIDLKTAKEKILVGTRRLYKHQMTWFKKLDVTWIEIDPDNPDAAWPVVRDAAEQHFLNRSS
jgi:tRNA dimethylallyltransferase